MWKQLLLLIVGWYSCSISLSVYNKLMFDKSKGLHVPYPILVTSFHQFTLWFISIIFIRLNKLHKVPTQAKKADGSTNWAYYYKFIIPLSFATAGDVGCSNLSFEFITLTVYTIIKSSSIAFVLLFGYLFKLEKLTLKLTIIVLIMFAGVVIMIYDPSHVGSKTSENLLLGSVLVFIGSALSGLRWVYTQLTLKNEFQHHQLKVENDDGTANDKPHPVLTVVDLAPIMGIILLVTSLIFEKPFPDFVQLAIFKTSSDSTEAHTTIASVSKGIVLLIFPGTLVFIMTLCEFGILQIAKVLTLSVAGVVKEVLTIIFGVLILHDEIKGWHNWLGIIIILLDVSYYNYFRHCERLQDSEFTAISGNEEAEVENVIMNVSPKETFEMHDHLINEER